MNLEDRIKRRLVIEDVDWLDVSTGMPPLIGSRSADIFVQLDCVARIAALEAEDTANPIAHTMEVKRSALDTTGPDLDAFAAVLKAANQ